MEEKKQLSVKETKEMLGKLLDSVEMMLGEFKDGKKMLAEMKDIDVSEGIELAMMVVLRLPKMIDAFKREDLA